MQNTPQSQNGNGNGNGQKSGLSWSTPSSAPAAKSASTPVVAPSQKALPVPVSSSTNMASYVGTLAGGIVIGVLLAWGYSSIHGSSTIATNSTNNAAAVTTTNTGTKDSTAMAATNSVALTLAPSQKAGMNVAISNVTVNKPTWVVVYDNVNGKPGNALGARLFFTTGSGMVTLLRATKAGTTYFVGTSIDNGDRKYAKATDKAVTASDGSVATVTFVAQQ